jgi:hypothetical protein
MDLDRLREGDFIKIKGDTYEILYFKTEQGVVKSPLFKIRGFLAIYLQDKKTKNKSLTNVLYIYPQKKEARLLTIEQEEPKGGLFGIKKQSSIISFKDEVKLGLEEIEEA